MVDKPENILVEFDYNNITIIDPNKVVDEFGTAKERLIKAEDLVMYANLECKLLPRTKLAIGVPNDDAIQTISIASINFLKPGGKEFLDNAYTDEITGKDTLRGEGVNQPKQTALKNPNKSDDYYIRQTINSGGKPGSTDNGLLGIKSISIRQNTSFTPQVKITLEDIKGRALFESGDQSPYAAFFNLPYPTFYLTIKGYLGKAVRLALMLTKFGASYDTGSGNFKIDLDFVTYKYTVLGEISMGNLLATPHMYKSKLSIQSTTGGPSKFTNVSEGVVEKGYQKIQELYSEYKSKGLIPDDFPELTILQLRDRLDVFIKNKLDTFAKQNMTPLTNLEKYRTQLVEYQGKVFVYSAGEKSWFNKYLDTKNFYVLDDLVTKVYTFNAETNTSEKRTTALSELQKLVTEYNGKLNENKTCGTGSDSGYEIGGKKVPASIPNKISTEVFNITLKVSDIDLSQTYRQRTGKEPTQNQLNELAAELAKTNQFNASDITLKNGNIILNTRYFVFEGQNRFMNLTKEMEVERLKIKEAVETQITNLLSDLLKNSNDGVGFVPNIRNVLAVIFASGEAFLRLMDDVHTKAWEQRDSNKRKQVVFNKEVAGASQDNLDSGNNTNTPVYPWPQVILATNGTNGQEKYEIRYPGDNSIIKVTGGDDYVAWPEIEFVEEFIKGFVQRTNPRKDLGSTNNEMYDIKRITFNAIEFPVTNQLFSNKEEVKYFYEIYERLIYISNFSKLSRVYITNSEVGQITELIAEGEKINIVNSLSNNNPYIIQKLKNYGLNSSNFTTVLKQFSNGGVGESWQNYLRGIFNTKYIKNQIENSQFEFLDPLIFGSKISQPQVSIAGEEKIIKFLTESTSSNLFDFTDTFPFTNLKWAKTNLANGETISDVNSSFDTRKTLKYNTSKKTITNFTETIEPDKVRPITNFVYKQVTEPKPVGQNQSVNLTNFYNERINNFKNQLVTEGNVRYSNYSGFVNNEQTTSIFNTPYFVNAIQEGVKNFRNYDKYPFVSAAYLFLNSLPLSTLREKYKSYESNQPTDLDYIFASLKKFGSLHKVPFAWVLKIGSIWHRYKKYTESGIDILNNSWKDFDSVTNYDPATSAATKTYSLTYKGANIDIILEDINVLGSQTSAIINTGFYPKVINDFNVFLQGFEIIQSNTQINGACKIDGTTLTVNQINGGLLQVGYILSGLNLEPNTTIVSFLTGTGGVGTYEINISQTTTTALFSVTNVPPTGGYSSTNINEAFNSGLTLNYVTESIISWSNSGETKNVRVVPWSITINTLDGKFSYLIPSNGSLLNQAKYECFKNNDLKIELTGNTSLHNGSIRTFWTSPNYGYYDNSRVSKPSPSDYLKRIITNNSTQENFSINRGGYTPIEEMLSVFEKSILDGFEKEFLNFSKSFYDANDNMLSSSSLSVISPTSDPLVIMEMASDNNTPSTRTLTEKLIKNFQSLMREMFKLPVLTGKTGTEVVTLYQSKQLENINNYVKQFLEFDVFFKYGNPSNYDRKLFYTFSNLPLVDPYEWDKYTIVTPNALPKNGGNVTLNTSRINYPVAWDALETYVGFSTISQLVYSNNGSYITDFFIDLNVAFTESNIKQFASIIKIYATQKLNQFQTNTIAPPLPVPSQPSTIVAIATLKNGYTISIDKKGPFSRAIYKSPDGILLFEGQKSFQLSNQTLFDEVIIGAYGNTTTNPNDPQFIVTIVEVDPPSYEAVPNTSNKKGLNAFYDAMTTYLNGVDDFQGKIIDVLIPKLQKDLPDVNNSPERQNIVEMNSEPQPKVELWETFKSLNDKWIAGNDFKNKTLFEDVLLLDRASRNIGDQVLIDIFKLRDTLSSIPPKVDMLAFVQTIIVENNFVVMNIPSYVNFYNVQEATKTPKPKLEGSMDFANTLFGTFLNVDYRNSSAKMVCFYGGKPSEQLDIKNVDFRFRSDAFDLRRVSDNPLMEDLIGKKDWDKSNKVVGFNVDIGPQNQSVFKNFSVGQNSGLATAESLEILNQMANQGGNRGGTTQNVSLYNLYKNRSYTCQISMIGNALIQPTMYFNLRNVPMFSGPYMILEVNHNITPGDFSTDFRGIRQPTAALPKIDNYLQALKTNLISKINEIITQEKDADTAKNPTNIQGLSNQAQNYLATNSNTINSNQNCTAITRYDKFILEAPSRNQITAEYAIQRITQIVLNGVATEDLANRRLLLAISIFSKLYIGSRSSQSNTFQAYGYNFMGLALNVDWGDLTSYTTNKFFCSNNNTPFLIFDGFDKNIEFLFNRWQPRMDVEKLPTTVGVQVGIDFITKFVIENGFNNKNEGVEFYNKIKQDGTLADYTKVVTEAYKLYDSIKIR
jgi:hypothetical protein